VEEHPPIGTGLVLQRDQVRYCIAEDVRIEAGRRVLDRKSSAAVRTFNEFIEDFNSRCSKFRYPEGVLDVVRQQVETVRDLLEAEGRARFAR